MRKSLWIFILFIAIILSSCQKASPDLIEIKLNESIDTIEIGSIYIDQGATARYGLKRLEVSVVSNSVNTETLGTYEIIYQATHENFSKTTKRMVTVIDETPPTIVLNPGVDTIYTDELWVDAGVIVTDLSGGDIEVIKSGIVLSTPGEYVITYIATDESGNSSIKVRYVNVIQR